MELYKRLPNELQQIIKYYTLCCPHKSLAFENKRTYTSYLTDTNFHTEYDEVVVCCNLNELYNNNPRIHAFGIWDNAYAYYIWGIHTHQICKEVNRSLLWYYFNLLSKEEYVEFINSNMTLSTRKRLCRTIFKKRFCKLSLTELKTLRSWIYHNV
jgi:hypothetical protein